MSVRRLGILTVLLALLPFHVRAGSFASVKESFPKLKLALSAVASSYGVPIGVEYAPSDPDIEPLMLDLKTDDISKVLDQLVLQRPAYKWSKEDGVYSVYPRVADQNFSSLRIQRYAIKDATLEEASRALSDIPEFQEFLNQRDLTRRELDTGGRWESKKRVTLVSRNIPLRRILNQLIKKFGLTQWTVIRYGEKLQYVAIYFHNA